MASTYGNLRPSSRLSDFGDYGPGPDAGLRIDVDNEAIRFDPAGAEALLDRLLGLVDQAGVREHRVELQLHD